ncbi:alternative cyclin pcl12 [Moniliophthora roreri MCA 2997]|uniref:Alternative cyclin pcl12 n=1 Tax=Moniliophthora roreri (strain MCA 2997) TaxID=1381753 RepID=V2XXP2_MONRO|nr:alternative cyclin pcl12 [Moniliophthora roreri MCA 2997]
MASVYPGQMPPPQPSDPKKAAVAAANRSRMSFQPMPPTSQPTVAHSRPDPFYGHENTARLCARFITHLFACPEYPPTTTQSQAKLPYFIAYALHRTKLHSSVTFACLVLLQRLKARFPTARGSSGHRLFISAFMIASKVICDDTYSNKSWTIVAQGMFTLREINQMEREMCNYLDWELTVDNPILENFENAVRQDFSAPQGPYPTYSLQMVSKRAAKAANSTTATPIPEPNSTTSPIPSFGQQRHSSPAGSADSSPAPVRKSSYSSSPMSDTPSPSYSNNTSPASSASPQTPIGPEDFTAKVHGYETPRGFAISDAVPIHHPLKTKMFAHAVPCGW